MPPLLPSFSDILRRLRRRVAVGVLRCQTPFLTRVEQNGGAEILRMAGAATGDGKIAGIHAGMPAEVGARGCRRPPLQDRSQASIAQRGVVPKPPGVAVKRA